MAEPTNFPKAGDDKPVSLRNSNFPRFDLAYAADLKANHPGVWKLGGNIKGNAQYAILSRIVKQGGAPKTRAEEAAVRLREAWCARHFDNDQPPGVVAQVKWLCVGTLGEGAMKKLLDEEKTKRASRGAEDSEDMNHAVATPAVEPRAGIPSAALAATDPGQAVRRPDGLCVRAAELSPLREAEREVDFTMSTNDVDSYGEIVSQKWDLTRFTKNPVALWAHQSRELPVGQWLNVRVEDGALKGTLKIASAQANPMAECIFHSIKERSLRAVSVGFVPGKVTYEEVDGVERCILDENVLFECSPTSIPANENAIAELKARAKAAFLEQRSANTTRSTPQTQTTGGKPATIKALRGTEGQMADENKCAHCSAQIDEEAKKHAAPLIERALGPVQIERTKAIADKERAEAEKATAIAERDAAKVAEKAARDHADAMQVRLLEAEIDPRIGTKVAPAEREGLVAIAKHFLSQPEGDAKWKAHLGAIDLRPNLATAPGSTSVIAKDATPPTQLGSPSPHAEDNFFSDLHDKSAAAN